MGPKSLQTNTAEWVGARSWRPPADGQDLRWLTAGNDQIKCQERRTYAAVAAAGVEPGGRLPSEDGDAAADRVAAVRLCGKSPRESRCTERKLSRADRDRRQVTNLPGSEPWRRT